VLVASLVGALLAKTWLAGPAVRYSGRASGPKVAVVGDSITALSEARLGAALADRYAYYVSGRSGATIAEQLPEIARIQASPEGPPSYWVVELGTNDSGTRQDRHWAASFDAEVYDLRGARCVVLLTVTPYLERFGPVAAQLNAAMADVAARQRNFHVLDWGGLSFAHPGWLEPDQIHPNATGQAALAFLVRQALDRDCPAPPGNAGAKMAK
jgi:lysophospholipase L1-like esterase